MKLTIFQERLPLPVMGYGGTERVSQSHFIGQCELNEHEVTLVCRTESTISHPNGKVIKLDEDILQDLRKGRKKVKDYIPDGDIILVQFPESTDPMDLSETNYKRVSVCNGDIGEQTGSKHQVFLTHGHKATHETFRSEDYSENKYVINNGLVYDDFELQKTREKVCWMSSVENRKSPEVFVNLVIQSLADEQSSPEPKKLLLLPKKYYFKAAGSHGTMNHEYINWLGELKTEKDKSDFFSDAEVYVHTAFSPNFNEPFGLSIIEAQFCGVPVIGLQSGGITEVVYDSELIFDNFNDLMQCLRDKKYLRHRPEDIRQWTIDKFSNTKMVENYNILFNRVLNEN